MKGRDNTRRAVVLIVEHNPRVRELLRGMLSSEGRKIVTAATAARALQLVSRAFPDLVMLDENLPGGGRTATLERLHRVSPNLPVVMISGVGSGDAVRAAMEGGALDYLTMPFDEDHVEHVAHLLDSRR